MKMLVLLVSFSLTCFTYAQIEVSKAGDGWNRQVDSALLLIKKTDIENILPKVTIQSINY